MSTILIAEARFYPHLNDMLLAGARSRQQHVVQMRIEARFDEKDGGH